MIIHLRAMQSERKPKSKEVLSEIGSDICNYTKRNLIDFLKGNSAVYFFPSFARKALTTKNTKDNELNPLGATLAFASILGQAYFYLQNSTDEYLPNQELWKIPLATNVLSLLYEFGREIYKEKEKQIMDRNKK